MDDEGNLIPAITFTYVSNFRDIDYNYECNYTEYTER